MNTPQTQRSPVGPGLRDDTHGKSVPNFSTAIDPAQRLLDRLEGVIKTGRGWRARCPAHHGKTASLAIAQGDNGTLLVHCFAGCDVYDVLSAVGLQVSGLFVKRDLRSMSPAERSRLRQAAMLPRWCAALEVLSHEAAVLLIAADKLGEGFELDDDELTRMRIAALKVFDARDALQQTEVRS